MNRRCDHCSWLRNQNNDDKSNRSRWRNQCQNFILPNRWHTSHVDGRTGPAESTRIFGRSSHGWSHTELWSAEGYERIFRLYGKFVRSIRNLDAWLNDKIVLNHKVLANDTDGYQDSAHVFIYLLREDQRVRFVLRQQPVQVRDQIQLFREWVLDRRYFRNASVKNNSNWGNPSASEPTEVKWLIRTSSEIKIISLFRTLSNVTNAIVNVDDFKVHENKDGSVDKTKTDLYMHLVDRQDNSIFEVDEVLRLIDQNIEKLDYLFKVTDRRRRHRLWSV